MVSAVLFLEISEPAKHSHKFSLNYHTSIFCCLKNPSFADYKYKIVVALDLMIALTSVLLVFSNRGRI